MRSGGPAGYDEVLSADDRYLATVDEAIATGHVDPGFGVAQLAEAVHQDRTHLYRRLKELTGQTPSQRLRTHRLERAARLLAARSGTVSEVAYAVGFHSVSCFSTAFRKHFGTPPSRYREAGAG